MSSGLDKDEKPRFAGLPKNGSANFTSASSAGAAYAYTNYVDVVQGGEFGTVIDSISITSDDTANRVVHLAVYNTATSSLRHLLSVTVTLGAGTNASTAVIDALSLTNASFLPSGSNGKKYIRLESDQEKLVAAINGATNSGKVVQVVARALDFEAA